MIESVQMPCSDAGLAAQQIVLTIFAQGTATYSIDANRLTIERENVGISATTP